MHLREHEFPVAHMHFNVLSIIRVTELRAKYQALINDKLRISHETRLNGGAYFTYSFMTE